MDIKEFINKENGFELAQVINPEKPNELWFVGKQVAEQLGYKKPMNAISKFVKGYHKSGTPLETNGGKQDVVIIDESGLYSLILKSKLPSARDFQEWVTSEVLPSIRKQGYYKLSSENKVLKDKIINDEPKVKIAESMMSKRNYLVREVANFIQQAGYECGEHTLYEWLRNNGYIYKEGKTNFATGQAVKQGLILNCVKGQYDVPMITPKGFDKFVTMFMNGDKNEEYISYVSKVIELELPLVWE